MFNKIFGKYLLIALTITFIVLMVIGGTQLVGSIVVLIVNGASTWSEGALGLMVSGGLIVVIGIIVFFIVKSRI